MHSFLFHAVLPQCCRHLEQTALNSVGFDGGELIVHPHLHLPEVLLHSVGGLGPALKHKIHAGLVHQGKKPFRSCVPRHAHMHIFPLNTLHKQKFHEGIRRHGHSLLGVNRR